MSKVKNKLLIYLVSIILVVGVTSSGFGMGKPLPPDAASEQILYYPLRFEEGTYVDNMMTIYNTVKGGVELGTEALTLMDKNLEVVLLGIEKVDLSEDNLTWTLHLRKELKWSDGNPITAYDYEFALHRAIEQGYDFAWYWQSAAGIKNWEKVEKGELPLEELGIKALDDYTLVITTATPKPYLLGVLAKLHPVPRHAVEKYGNEYATRAETMVCSGGYKMTEWVKGSHMTFVQNPYYEGLWKPYLQKIVLVYGTWDPQTGFPAYLNNEIYRSEINPGQFAYAEQNIQDQLHSWPQFRVYYLSFDTTMPPFDDVRVRKAFQHAVNREEMCSTVLKNLALPEYALLMGGFPGSDPSQVKELSEYDPELARKLLAEAGYPDGKGFPELELWFKDQNDVQQWQVPAGKYLQAQFKEILGISIIPRSIEVKTFNDAMYDHTHSLFLTNYQFDYVDPSNFMDLFITGGRHAWSNPEYDELVRASSTIIDWEDRLEMYRKAEKILAQEAPAVFAFKQVSSAVWKPFIKGEGVEPNDEGIPVWGEMEGKYIMSHIYIAEH